MLNQLDEVQDKPLILFATHQDRIRGIVIMESPKVTYVTLLADETIHPKYEQALKTVEKEFGEHHPMYVSGKKIFSRLGEFEKTSPINTGILLGYFQKGSAGHAREAIKAAREAFAKWSSRDWTERVEIISKAAQILESRRFPLATLITYEVGKNRYEAVAEAAEAADMLRYYAQLMERNQGYVKAMDPGAPGEVTKSVMKPHGVFVVISPFNFPLALAAGMVVGALITGNTVVFKPTSEAPFSGLKLYEILVQAGVPSGAINFVTGPGGSFGDEVTRNKDVDGIAFTGSKDVGMKLYRDFVANQPYPKPFIAEMGSKNPAVITSKADLEKAVEGVVRGAFGYGGQKCSATSRVYVQRNVKNQFLNLLKERLEKVRVGDPRRKEAFLGPVINDRAFKNYQKHVLAAKSAGGKFVAGVGPIKDGEFKKGYYVKPTIITGLDPNHKLFRDELFLPILLVDEFNGIDDAMTKANRTEFGLTAGIFSEDGSEVEHFFKNIQFGVTYANRKGGATTGAWPGAQSFGGWKASGCTGKGVGGPYYLLQFVREQAQTIVGPKFTRPETR